MPPRTDRDDVAPGRRLATLLSQSSGTLTGAALAEAARVGPDVASEVVSGILVAELAAPSRDRAAMAALSLAGELRLEGAAPAVVACLVDRDVDEAIHEAAFSAFSALGAFAVEPLLAAAAVGPDPDLRAAVVEAVIAAAEEDECFARALHHLLGDDVAAVAGTDLAARARGARRPGRNDPCHCGSGAKYKKCHLPSDERRDE